MTINEVSKKYNLTPDTLRYYEKIGLLKNIPRTKGGIRNYDEINCQRIEFVKCMRDAGVEIGLLKEYFYLFEQGKKTVKARKELLQKQKNKLLIKKENLISTLEKLDYKISLYEEIEKGNRKDFTEI